MLNEMQVTEDVFTSVDSLRILFGRYPPRDLDLTG